MAGGCGLPAPWPARVWAECSTRPSLGTWAIRCPWPARCFTPSTSWPWKNAQAGTGRNLRAPAAWRRRRPRGSRWRPRCCFWRAGGGGLRPDAWIAVSYLGLLASVLVVTLQAWGQQRVDAMRSAIVFGLEPVFAALTAWVLLGEQLGWAGCSGAALIVGALVFSQITPPARAVAAQP